MGSVSTREAGVEVGLKAQQLVRSAFTRQDGQKKAMARVLGEIGLQQGNRIDQKGPRWGRVDEGEFWKGEDEKGKISGRAVRSQTGRFGGERRETKQKNRGAAKVQVKKKTNTQPRKGKKMVKKKK